MGGSPRKSIEIHKLQGSYRADRHAPKLPPAEPGEFDITPPAHLGDAGLAAWGEYTTIFRHRGTLDAAYRPALVDVCRKHDELARHRAVITIEGELITLPNGIQTAHPACKLRDKCERAISEFRKAFGLTAASSAAIGISTVKPTLSALETFKRSTGLPSRNRTPGTSAG